MGEPMKYTDDYKIGRVELANGAKPAFCVGDLDPDIKSALQSHEALVAENQDLKDALKERLRFMTEHFEANGKDLSKAQSEIESLEAERDRYRKALFNLVEAVVKYFGPVGIGGTIAGEHYAKNLVNRRTKEAEEALSATVSDRGENEGKNER
jgi:signal transduction histidine kinase